MDLRRAVFLDRDGTICRDLNYLSDPDRVELLAGAAPALRRLQAEGFLLIVVTNQSGIARGYLTESTLAGIHDRLRAVLNDHGVRITAFYYCPHLPDGILPEFRQTCSCRKPEPGLLLQAAREHGVDLDRSFMVGDKPSDIQAGKRAGCRALLLHPGRSESLPDFAPSERPDAVMADLSMAVNWILESEAQ